jgi:hypothetical protein
VQIEVCTPASYAAEEHFTLHYGNHNDAVTVRSHHAPPPSPPPPSPPLPRPPPAACPANAICIGSSSEGLLLVKNDLQTWIGAKDRCVSIGGVLSGIHNREQDDALWADIDTNCDVKYSNGMCNEQFWIGLSGTATGENIVWEDGSTSGYAPIHGVSAQNNLDGDKASHVCVYKGYLGIWWTETTCAMRNQYICDMRKSLAPLPPPSPPPTPSFPTIAEASRNFTNDVVTIDTLVGGMASWTTKTRDALEASLAEVLGVDDVNVQISQPSFEVKAGFNVSGIGAQDRAVAVATFANVIQQELGFAVNVTRVDGAAVGSGRHRRRLNQANGALELLEVLFTVQGLQDSGSTLRTMAKIVEIANEDTATPGQRGSRSRLINALIVTEGHVVQVSV